MAPPFFCVGISLGPLLMADSTRCAWNLPFNRVEDRYFAKGQAIRLVCPLAIVLLFEVIDEGGYALNGFLAGFLNFNGKLYICLDGTAEVLDFVQLDFHAYALS